MPKYEQVKRQLIEEIERGRWIAGSVVPSEAELLRRFNVSRPTLVRSLQDLAREGYVYSRQGKGRFVADRSEQARASQRSLPLFISSETAALSGDAREVLLRMMRGIQSALGPAGMELNLRSADEGPIDSSTRRFLETAPPSTALMIEPSFSPALRHELVKLGWRVWSINEPLDDGNCVYIDQEHAGYIATRYLLDRGRKRIALLNGPVQEFWGFRARLAGYRRALEDAGLAADPALILEGSHVIDSEAGRAMMRRLLQSHVQFDGIVGASDAKGIGARTAAEEAGRRIPDEIAFVSIDNTLAGRASKPMPAVNMPFEELGRCAAMQAIEQVGPAEVPFHACIQLKPTLVEQGERL